MITILTDGGGKIMIAYPESSLSNDPLKAALQE